MMPLVWEASRLTADVRQANGSLLTLELVRGIAGGSVAMWCGVRDDGTAVLSCSAGAPGGVCGPV